MEKIKIPLERYEELVKLEERVNVIVNYYDQNKYMDAKMFLSILGTELALELANEIEKRDKVAMERMFGDTE